MLGVNVPGMGIILITTAYLTAFVNEIALALATFYDLPAGIGATNLDKRKEGRTHGRTDRLFW